MTHRHDARYMDAETVIYRLEEAGRTLIALPSKGCLPAQWGNGWPQVVHAAAEAYGYDPEQIRPPAPEAQAITRMDEAWRWVSEIPEDKKNLRRIVLMRALVHPVTERHRWSWRRIGRSLGWDYRAIQRWHAQGIDLIVAGLREAGVEAPPRQMTRARRRAMTETAVFD